MDNQSDLFQSDDVADNSEEWREPSNGTAMLVFISVAYCIIHALCLFGNALVLVIIVRHSKMRSVTNFFLANLAAADLMVALFCTAQHLLLYIVLENWIFEDGPIGIFLCKTYGFFRSLAYCASTSILLMLAFERFLAIVHPFTSRSYLLSRSTLKWCALVVWLISIVVSVPSAVFFDVMMHQYPTKDGENITTQYICFRDHTKDVGIVILDIFTFLCFYLIPCVAMAILYTFVGRKLWKSTKSDLGVLDSSRHAFSLRSSGRADSVHSSQRHHSDRGRWERHSLTGNLASSRQSHTGPNSSISSDPFHCTTIIMNRRKVIRMLIVIVTVFAMCWLPVHIRKLVVALYGQDAGLWLYAWFTPFSDWLINVNSAVNPLIYALFSDKFRSGMAEILRCQSPRTPFSRGARLSSRL